MTLFPVYSTVLIEDSVTLLKLLYALSRLRQNVYFKDLLLYLLSKASARIVMFAKLESVGNTVHHEKQGETETRVVILFFHF